MQYTYGYVLQLPYHALQAEEMRKTPPQIIIIIINKYIYGCNHLSGLLPGPGVEAWVVKSATAVDETRIFYTLLAETMSETRDIK